MRVAIKLSIITISFNQQQYLRECLDSVSGQLAAGDEYIVVDPGSRDGSRELISEYAHAGKVSKTIFEPDRGPADGLNRGFAAATGDVLAYLNSDDFYLPGALAHVRRIFTQHAATDVVISPIRQIHSDGRFEWRGRATTGLSVRGIAAGRCYYLQQGTFIRSSAFRKTPGFNLENRSCWDYELFAELVFAGARVRAIARPLGAFRIHGESISGRGDHWAMTAHDRARIEKRARSLMGWPATASPWARLIERGDPIRRAIEFMCGFYRGQ